MSTSKEQRVFGSLIAPDIAELINSDQLEQVRLALMDLLDPEIADVIEALEGTQQALVLGLLPVERGADVLTLMPPDLQEQLLHDIQDEHQVELLDEIDPDDRAELFEELPDDFVEELQVKMDPAELQATQKLLEYPEESVGRLMTPEYLTIRPEWEVRRALDHIREYGAEAETVNVLYVIDSGGKLQDFVRLRKLVLADPAAKCESLCKGRVRSLLATDDQEEAVRKMNKYDTPVLPVVDAGGVLVGIVTFDDVADIAEEEVTEDMQKMGGMRELDEPYIDAPLMELVQKRVGWLLILFCGGLVAVFAMGFFDEALEKYAILALFVPLIIASGGNSGSQAASLLIRSLTTEEVDTGDWLRVLKRELASGLVMGGILGICGFIVGFAACYVQGLAGHDSSLPMRYGIAIGVSVMAVIMVGTLTGGMLPLLLKKLGFDPAAGSTPLVATIVDAAGLIIYFLVAVMVLR